MLGSKRKIEELRRACKEEHLNLLEAKAVINELREENQQLRASHQSAWNLCADYKMLCKELTVINRRMEEELNGRDNNREM